MWKNGGEIVSNSSPPVLWFTLFYGILRVPLVYFLRDIVSAKLLPALNVLIEFAYRCAHNDFGIGFVEKLIQLRSLFYLCFRRNTVKLVKEHLLAVTNLARY